MKKIFYLFSFAFLLSIAACKQDKCEGLICQYDGSCKNGVCVCNTAHTGPHCELFTNACDTTRCYYGGYCLNGGCNCPGHTSGDSCTILETPSKMYITGATINHFSPADPNGHTWDWDEAAPETGTSADIYPVIKKNGVTIYAGRQHNLNYNYFANAQYDSQHKFIFHEDSILITFPDLADSIFRFELYDYDFAGGVIDSDYMGGFNFRPYTGRDGFPGGMSYQDTSAYLKQFEYSLNYSIYYEW
jgi:hypothetical protein